MNELTVVGEDLKKFPMIYQGIKIAEDIFDSIKSWEDIERVFFKGNGLSKHTYRSYMASTKEFFLFTNNLHPLKVTPAHIEMWYDDMVKRLDKKSVVLKIAGLKRFFKSVREKCPLAVSPFEIMGTKLLKKIMKVPKGNGVVTALTSDEIAKLLDFLSKDKTKKGMRNYALVYMLITTGFRISELLDLSWGDIVKEYDKDGNEELFGVGIGKGNKEFRQPLDGEAINAVLDYHKKVYDEIPNEDEYLFYNFTTGKNLATNTAWCLINAMWFKIEAIGLFDRTVKLHPHLFRASFCSGLVKSGMPLEEVKILSRHSDYNTLLNHYVNVDVNVKPYLDKYLKRT